MKEKQIQTKDYSPPKAIKPKMKEKSNQAAIMPKVLTPVKE